MRSKEHNTGCSPNILKHSHCVTLHLVFVCDSSERETSSQQQILSNKGMQERIWLLDTEIGPTRLAADA